VLAYVLDNAVPDTEYKEITAATDSVRVAATPGSFCREFTFFFDRRAVCKYVMFVVVVV